MNFDNDTTCYDSDDVPESKNTKNTVPTDLDVEQKMPESVDDKGHVTDTSDYDSMEFEIVSPEDAVKQAEQKRASGPINPEFVKSISILETKLGRKLSDKEYDDACRKYATVLCERDEYAKNKYCEKVMVNPRNCEIYYQLIKHNRPITSMTEVAMRSYEDTMIAPIAELMKIHSSCPPEPIEIKEGERVNIRHGGKVRIAEDQGGRVIVIDNKRDVALLHMKQRQDWIDKNFKDQLINGTSFNRPSEDEFE